VRSINTTWNPIVGCSKVSPGCGLPRLDGDRAGGCYAIRMAARLQHLPAYTGTVHHTGTGLDRTGTVHCLPGRLREPLSWRRPRMVFLNSMSDVGHDAVSDVFLAAMWATMFWTSHEVSGGSRQRPGTPPVHTYQILTKRPARLRTGLRRWSDPGQRTAMLTDAAARGWAGKDDVAMAPGMPPVLPNVWLGTSIETDDYTHRADHLRRAPAATRFLSLEPLLGPLPSLDLTGIDWVIVGGESGPGSRTLDLNWVRDLRDRATRQDIAFFFKAGRRAHPQSRKPDTRRPHLGPDARRRPITRRPPRANVARLTRSSPASAHTARRYRPVHLSTGR